MSSRAPEFVRSGSPHRRDPGSALTQSITRPVARTHESQRSAVVAATRTRPRRARSQSSAGPSRVHDYADELAVEICWPAVTLSPRRPSRGDTDLVLHLHRLDHADEPAGFDRVAVGHVDEHVPCIGLTIAPVSADEPLLRPVAACSPPTEARASAVGPRVAARRLTATRRPGPAYPVRCPHCPCSDEATALFLRMLRKLLGLVSAVARSTVHEARRAEKSTMELSNVLAPDDELVGARNIRRRAASRSTSWTMSWRSSS